MSNVFSEYEAAAKNNDSDAQFELSKIFKQGDLVDKDLEKSFYWLTKSSENGNMKAKHNLGHIYLEGLDGIANSDSNKAIELFLSAAESGLSASQFILGTLYADGYESIKQDAEKAAYWIIKAAENNSDNAKFMFAFFFRKNNGVITDAELALRWLREAAENEHRKAQEFLGLWYMTGDQYLTKDTEQGNKWLAKGRGDGSTDTLQNIASDYVQSANLHKYNMSNKADSEITPEMRVKAMKDLSALDRDDNKWYVYSPDDKKIFSSSFDNVKQVMENDSVVSIAVFTKDHQFIKEFPHRNMIKRDVFKLFKNDKKLFKDDESLSANKGKSVGLIAAIVNIFR